jgi:SAM-dependent methyltransferase
MRLALQVAPQQSTQYADMAFRLAGPELRASPLRAHLEHVEPVRLGGADYVLVTLGGDPRLAELMPVLSLLGATSCAFEYLDAAAGPLLRPLDPAVERQLPREMAEIRRYKGKTSEVFTRVLLNLSLFAGRFLTDADVRLRVLDPLAGGGTTLFAALAAGHDAFGIEQEKRDVETTAAFVGEYCREARIPHNVVHDKAKRRFRFELGPRADQRLLVLAQGDGRSADSVLADVPGSARFHAIATDLPYGIQHDGAAVTLVREALPAWERVLLPGGAMALAWDATRLPREKLTEVVSANSGLAVRDDGPYAELEHRVDRVIKRRDVLVVVKPG